MLFRSVGFYPSTVITALIIAFIYSFFLLTFGEYIPKALAAKNSENIALRCAGIMSILVHITKPSVRILLSFTALVAGLLGVSPNEKEEEVTEEEIRMLIDVGGETGSIHETEKEMINNIFKFDDISVEEIATHRTGIVAIDINSSFQEIAKIVANKKFSRIPVYEENIDNIIGVLNIRDLFYILLADEQTLPTEINIRAIMRKPYFVPLSKKTDELFAEMQKNKIHMSIVIDEYGGTAGIVTMEDLIEEVMGDILDEHDEEEVPDIEQIFENTFVISGTTDLDIVNDLFETSLPLDEYETVSGFIIGQIGRIPDKDERPEIIFGNLIFKVLGIDEKRISQVVVFCIGDNYEE